MNTSVRWRIRRLNEMVTALCVTVVRDGQPYRASTGVPPSSQDPRAGAWQPFDAEAALAATESRRAAMSSLLQSVLNLSTPVTSKTHVPRPRCRDCADHDGTCPQDGSPCDPREVWDDVEARWKRIALDQSRTVNQILDAMGYDVKRHGHLPIMDFVQMRLLADRRAWTSDELLATFRAAYVANLEAIRDTKSWDAARDAIVATMRKGLERDHG